MTTQSSLAHMIHNNAKHHGDILAYVDGERQLTHRELAARALKLASACYKAGCYHQDRIAIYSMNRLEYGEVYAAGQISGLIIATVNFRLAPAEVLSNVSDSGAKVLIFEDTYSDTINAIRAQLPDDITLVVIGQATDWAQDYESFIGTGDDCGPPFQGAPQDIASILYTSGSTGRPKGCILGQREFTILSEALAKGMRISETDRIALPMPMFHLGAKSLQCAMHWRGGTVVILREFRPEAYLRTLQNEKITKCHLAPTMVQMLLELPDLEKYDTSSVSMIMYSAGAMPVSILRRAIEVFGNVFMNSYGMTESIGTLLTPEQHHPDGTPAEQEWLNSVGQPFPNVEIKIMLDEETEATTGEPGEIFIKAEGAFRGYWNDSVTTIMAKRGGWYHTGDIGRKDAGGFIYLVDRKKDMIVSGGENIYSREVEDALLTHPAIQEVAVIAIPDDKWGESVRALVLARPEHELTEQDVIAHSKSLIASYKKPRSVVFVDDIPKLASGKVNKVVLRDLYGA